VFALVWGGWRSGRTPPENRSVSRSWLRNDEGELRFLSFSDQEAIDVDPLLLQGLSDEPAEAIIPDRTRESTARSPAREGRESSGHRTAPLHP